MAHRSPQRSEDETEIQLHPRDVREACPRHPTGNPEARRAAVSLNEVPNGIPMPPAYCEIIKYAIGTQTASEFTLFGQVYDLEAASRMGVVQKTVAECSGHGAALLTISKGGLY